MKKTTFTLLLFLFCCRLAAQCPTGDVIFSTQGQVDSFPQNYPNCFEIPGNVVISGSSIVGLDSLYSLKTIGGRLLIEQTSLTNLTGLNQLDSVKSDFAILYNPNLTVLAGLENLRFVGKYGMDDAMSYWEVGLKIYGNPVLNSLSGLDNLVTSAGCVSIQDNEQLQSLEGLGKLTDIGGCFSFVDDGTAPVEGLSVSENLFLTSLDGLGAVNSLVALDISYNPFLASLSGLSTLRNVGYNVSINSNYSLKSLYGLNKLRRVGKSLNIYANDSLPDFKGLEKLDTIGGRLRIVANASLVSLDGLEGLDTIGRIPIFLGDPSSLFISQNPQLASIQGLDKVKFGLGKIEIKTCPNLAVCHVQSICENLARVTASDNAPGCNNVAEVEAACTVSIGETFDGEPVIIFSPNPASDFLQIQIEGNEKWDISLFDLQGRQMYRQRVSDNQIIEVKDWPSGIYALRAVSGGRVYAGRFVKR